MTCPSAFCKHCSSRNYRVAANPPEQHQVAIVMSQFAKLISVGENIHFLCYVMFIFQKLAYILMFIQLILGFWMNFRHQTTLSAYRTADMQSFTRSFNMKIPIIRLTRNKISLFIWWLGQWGLSRSELFAVIIWVGESTKGMWSAVWLRSNLFRPSLCQNIPILLTSPWAGRCPQSQERCHVRMATSQSTEQRIER